MHVETHSSFAVEKPRIFYGWRVVAAAALGLFLGAVPIAVFSFGVFLKPLSQDFHAGRSAIALASTHFNLVVAATSPVAGRLSDRYGARKVIILCTVILAAILVASPILSATLWQLYAFYLALGLVAIGTAPVPYGKLVSHWFDRQRGLALGLMSCGLAVGAIVMPSLEQRLIVRFGWRGAFAVMGGVVLVVSVPMLSAFLKEKPEDIDLLPDGAPRLPPAAGAGPNLGMKWHEVWRGRTFWVMVSAFCLMGGTLHACLIHLPAMLADRGSTARTGALASSILGIGVLIARFVSSYLLDRLFGPYVAVLFFSGVGLGLALLRLTAASEPAFVAAFLIGMGLGAEADLLAYLATRYFGLPSIGEVYGYLFSSFLLGGALVGYLMGLGFDRTRSYALPLSGVFVTTMLAIFLVTRLGPYRYAWKLPVTS